MCYCDSCWQQTCAMLAKGRCQGIWNGSTISTWRGHLFWRVKVEENSAILSSRGWLQLQVHIGSLLSYIGLSWWKGWKNCNFGERISWTPHGSQKCQNHWIVGNDDVSSVDGIFLQGLYKPQNVQNGNSVNQRLQLAGFYTPQKRKYQQKKEKHLLSPPIFGVPAVGRFRGCFFFFFFGSTSSSHRNPRFGVQLWGWGISWMSFSTQPWKCRRRELRNDRFELNNGSVVQLSSDQNPGKLLYRGDYTTQLHGDCNKPLLRIPF